MTDEGDEEDSRRLGLLDVYELSDAFEGECVDCGATDTITAIVKTLDRLSGMQRRKDEGEGTWESVQHGWVCPECHDNRKRDARERETRNHPDETVEEPPSEWRFCQRCGEQLDFDWDNPQYCPECAT